MEKIYYFGDWLTDSERETYKDLTDYMVRLFDAGAKAEDARLEPIRSRVGALIDRADARYATAIKTWKNGGPEPTPLNSRF